MIELFIFLLVVFLYVHIVVQYKSSEHLDIYELDYYDNVNLQKSCDLLQPFIFSSIDFPKIDEVLTDPENVVLFEKGDSMHPFQIPFNLAKQLYSDNRTPIEKLYYSDTKIDTNHCLDSYLKPPFTIQTDYHLMMATPGCTTPFIHHRNSRRFLVIQEGEISLKLAPWKKNQKHLYEIYETGQVRSLIDVWSPSIQYRKSWEKVEFVDVLAKSGQILYLPPFWGYSIYYKEPNTRIYSVTYSTIFNRLAFLGEIIQTELQKENTVYKTWPSIKSQMKEEPTKETELNQEHEQEKEQNYPTNTNEIHKID